MKPYGRKLFWFYDDWLGTRPSFGGDEYGCHTLVLPLGKRRAVVFVIWPCYLFDTDCSQQRRETLRFYQDLFYIQTYWNVEELDDLTELEEGAWNTALGFGTKGETDEEAKL